MPIASAFRTLLYFVGIALFALVSPMVRAQSAVDGFDPNVSGGNVYAVAIQPDGKVILAGDFTSTRPNGAGVTTTVASIARYNPDGTLDASFAPLVNGRISAVVLQPSDGSILIGGRFTSVNGVTRNHVARLSSTGTLDAFNPNVTGALTNDVTSLAVQANGQVLVGGGFTSPTNRLARFNADGSLDSAFNPNFNGLVSAIALQADGKILVGGGFTSLQPAGATAPTLRNYVARLNSNGSVDAGFDPHANDAVSSIDVQRDQRIIMGGAFTSLQPNNAATATQVNRVSRLEPDGTVSPFFYGGTNGPVAVVKIQPDGRILIGGAFDAAGNSFRRYAARLLPDGTLDADFAPGTNFSVNAFGIQSDGSIILGGGFTAVSGSGIDGVPRNHVARVSIQGALDADFRPDANGRLWALSVQSDGMILAAGSFTSVGGATHNGLVRLDANGTIQPGFAPDFNGTVVTAVQQANGKILVGGAFTRVNGLIRTFFARLNADGTLDTAFDSSTADQVTSIAVQADGKIIIGGVFTQLRPNATTEPVSRSRLARLNPDGSLDLTFNTAASSVVRAIVVQPDGKILIGGEFTSIQVGTTAAVNRFGIARLNTDGSVDPVFDPNVNGVVFAIALQADGKIVFGGRFAQLAANNALGQTRNNIARVESTGALDATFDPNINGTVSTLLATSDKKIVAGGSFTSVMPAGTTTAVDRNYVVRLLENGSVDTTFAFNLDRLPGNLVVGLAETGGKILIGGAFTNATTGTTSVQRSRLLRVNSAGTIDESFNSEISSASGAAVQVVTSQANTRVIAAGSFANFAGTTGSSVARFFSESAPDLVFAPTVNGTVYTVAEQPLLGQAVATQHPGLAWLESNGQLRSSFGPTSTVNLTTLRQVVIQDGKLLVAGTFNVSGTTPSVIRFLADGTVDPTFTPAVNGNVVVLRVLSDGKILVGGTFTQLGDVKRNNLARLNSDGSLDTTFDPSPDGTVSALDVQSDGKIIVGGAFGSIGSGTALTRGGVARINADGTGDASFNPAPNGLVGSIAVLPGGKILIGGQFTAFLAPGATAPTTRTYLARLNTDGTVDAAFDMKVNAQVTKLVVDADSQVLVAGDFSLFGGESRNYLARLKADGTLDLAFDPNPNSRVFSVAVQPDKKIVLGGEFTYFLPGNSSYASGNAIPRSQAARLNPDGSVDATFNPDFDAAVAGIFVAPDGSIIAVGNFRTIQPRGSLLIGGSFSTINNAPVSNLALFGNDGSISSTFVPNPNGAVYAIVPLSNGTTVIGGAFTTISGASRNRMVRYLSSDTVDTSFNPNVDGDVLAIVAQPDGKFVIGGSFNTVGGASRPNIARLNANGSLDTSFGASVTGPVQSLALQKDGKILYTRVTTGSDAALGRLNADGSVDTSFVASNNKAVSSIAVQADGQILVGGSFTTIGGGSRNYLARLNADGTLDASFTPTPNGAVTALSIQADGKLLIGGLFSAVDGVPRFGLARIGTKSRVVSALSASADSKTLIWTRGGGSPEIYGAVFESSSDSVTWTVLGAGTRVGSTSDWQLSGVSLTAFTNLYVRARGLSAVTPHASVSVVSTQTLLYPSIGSAVTPSPPVISSATAVNGAVGSSFLYAIAASGSPTSYSASGLPAGLSLNTSTGLITGTPTVAGTFVVTLNATNAGGSGSTTLNLFVAPSAATTANPGRLIDLSVNAQVTSTDPIIVGFVVTGTQPQNVVLRAVGPTLASYGVTNPLAAPHLRLFGANNALILERDGWDGSSDLSTTFARLGAFVLAGGSADAAVLVTLSPGVYSMHVTTTSSTGGIALAEIYDASPTPPPQDAARLVNVSSRGKVGGGRIVTAGFVIIGDTSKRVLVRGVGPGLTAAGVANALADPMITLFRSQNGTSTAIGSNGNWGTTVTSNSDYPVATAADVSTTTAAVGGFALASGSADAAILVTLPPGVYSAQVSDQSGTAAAGDALVEIYDVP